MPPMSPLMPFGDIGGTLYMVLFSWNELLRSAPFIGIWGEIAHIPIKG